MLTEVFIVLLSLLLVLYAYLKYNTNYFKLKGVPYIPANPFLGNLTDLLLGRVDPNEMTINWYNHPAGENQSFVGFHLFQEPGILIRDPELVKRICIKDFDKFSNRYFAADPKNDPLSALSLFFTKNPLWKMIRTKLTPVFSSGKVKQFFPLVEEIGREMETYLEKVSKSNKCVDIKLVCDQFATDVIASVVFGLETNSFKNPMNDFFLAGQDFFHTSLRCAIDRVAVIFNPKLVPHIRAKVVTTKVETFFRKVLSSAIEERKKSGFIRNDLVDILIAFKNASMKGDTELELTDDMCLAQAEIFFIAGFETSSSAIAFTLYELAWQPEIQDRLRKEINFSLNKENGNISFETINSMEYLNMVLNETLRLYVPIPFMSREVTLNPNETGYSLEPFSDFVMPQGMPVYIPAAGIHRDPKYFPNPLKFDPERFSAENKINIVPGSYIPFGIGGRACIGSRFGTLKAKIGLIYFLKNYIVKPNKKTVSYPIRFKKSSLLLQPDGGIFLDVHKC